MQLPNASALVKRMAFQDKSNSVSVSLTDNISAMANAPTLALVDEPENYVKHETVNDACFIKSKVLIET
jgi:hypothetical protein